MGAVDQASVEEAAARTEPAASVAQLLASGAERDSGHADASEEHELASGHDVHGPGHRQPESEGA